MWLFQSTLSVRRATSAAFGLLGGLGISIHALRKESDSIDQLLDLGLLISIHALRKESDSFSALENLFNTISIHALRKESDERG